MKPNFQLTTARPGCYATCLEVDINDKRIRPFRLQIPTVFPVAAAKDLPELSYFSSTVLSVAKMPVRNSKQIIVNQKLMRDLRL